MKICSSAELGNWLTESPRIFGFEGVSGALPTYTPKELNSWAAAVATQQALQTRGAKSMKFPLMSAVKPFLLLYLLQTIGEERVFTLVGRDASAQPFFSVSQLVADQCKPRNAMINSGAMLLADQLPGATPEAAMDAFLHWLNSLADTGCGLNAEVFHYCMETEDSENRQLASLLAAAGATQDADRMFDVYFRLCCVECTIVELALLGRLLAFPHPQLDPQHQQTVREVMATCGLYQASGAWFTKTGIPAKSGVSGALIGVIPGKYAIATFSPWINNDGNPVQAMRMLKAIAKGVKESNFEKIT